MDPYSDGMFATAEELLRRQGASFAGALRTRIYLDNIDRDYGDFNASRNALFRQHGIQRRPASTDKETSNMTKPTVRTKLPKLFAAWPREVSSC